MIEQIYASLLVLLGVYLYGLKSYWGPMVSVIACLEWAQIGSHAGMLPMVALNLVLVAVHAWNLIKWGNER